LARHVPILLTTKRKQIQNKTINFTKDGKMKNLIIATIAVAGIALFNTSNVEAGHKHRRGIRFSVNFGGHSNHGHHNNHNNYRWGSNRGHGYNHSTWHNTSHYDYHPGQFTRHNNHYHYTPGHYDYHRTGHWDTHHRH
jgi:hypothetical protein